MKQLLTTLFVCSTVFLGKLQAQILKPVKWSYAAKKTSATEAIIYLKATIDPTWHIYSQQIKEDGPVKTSFKFSPSKSYTPVGQPIEPKPVTKYEKAFEMQVSYFEGAVIFQQKMKLSGNTPVNVTGSLEYMTCNDKQCLPPETLSFSIPVK